MNMTKNTLIPLSTTRSRQITRFATALVATAVLAVSAPVEDEANHADHEALRALRQVYETAASKGQLELLAPYVDDEFTAVMMTNRQFDDFASLKEQWARSREKFVGNGNYEMGLEPELSLILGDIAIARGDSWNRITTESGDQLEFKAKWTAVLRKRKGTWKIVRAHGSMDPFGNELLRRAVVKHLIIVAVGAFLAGAILAAFLGRIISSRKKKPTPAAT